MSNKNKCKRTAFTLTELIVVLGIIALMIALFLPSSDSLKTETKQTSITKNKDTLTGIVGMKLTRLRSQGLGGDALLAKLMEDLSTEATLTSMTNPFDVTKKGIGLIKGDTYDDTNKAVYIFTMEPKEGTLPKGTTYTVVKPDQLLAEGLPDIEINPGTNGSGSGGTTGGTGGTGGTVKPPSTGTTGNGVSDDALDRYFAKQLALQLSDFATYKGDWAATASTAGATGLVFANYIGTAFEPYQNLKTIEDVFSNSAAMTLVTNSSMAMDAIVASTAAQNALVKSTAAISTVATSSMALYKLLTNTTMYPKLYNSTLTMAILANSKTAMSTIVTYHTEYNFIELLSNSITSNMLTESTIAMTALAKSGSVVNLIAHSSEGAKITQSKIAMEAFANSSTASLTMAKGVYAYEWSNFILNSTIAKEAIANSSIAMTSFNMTNNLIAYANDTIFSNRVANSQVAMEILAQNPTYLLLYMVSSDVGAAELTKSEIALTEISKVTAAISRAMGYKIFITNLAATTINLSKGEYTNLIKTLASKDSYLSCLAQSTIVSDSMIIALQPYKATIDSALASSTLFTPTSVDVYSRVPGATYALGSNTILIPISCYDYNYNDITVYSGSTSVTIASMQKHTSTVPFTNSGIGFKGVTVKGSTSYTSSYARFTIYTTK